MINNHTINKNFKKGPGRHSGGFTIIETLMAVFVLSVAIAGSLALASKGLDTILVARQEVAAAYLAQNGMEFIRSFRDTNCLVASASDPTAACPNTAWLVGSGGRDLKALCAGSGCYIGTISGIITSCSGVCPVMNYNTSDHTYTYAATNGSTILPTIYTRSIYVKSPVGGSAGEASTTVVISWPSAGGVVRSVRVHDDLFNWQ